MPKGEKSRVEIWRETQTLRPWHLLIIRRRLTMAMSSTFLIQSLLPINISLGY